MTTVVCQGCKIALPQFDGPTHPYIGSNAACWKLYGEVLEREYSNPQYYKMHRYTVDAYAVQHPGIEERKAIQSVNGHLVALYLLLEQKLDSEFATQALKRVVDTNKGKFQWLKPPADLGSITVLDVSNATTPKEHEKLVADWARCVWFAWKDYHPAIARLASTVI